MPGYRGRLIFPQVAVIARLNTVKTRANDPPGTVDAGYDDVFREPRVFTNASGERDDTRVDDLIRVPCQIEDFVFQDQRQLHAGNNPNTRYTFVFHLKDLEKLGLINTEGQPLIGPNDRVVEVRDKCNDRLIQKFRDPPGMFFTEARPGFGIGSNRNLLILKAEERETGASATA